ncbi:MAG: hypothetical protein GC200_04660 [Tepidisphaera sp.]|nr:hypothetical protein [Tepidisphaera sp.]
MKNRIAVLCPLVLAALAGSAFGQTVDFTQWNFNNIASGQIVNNPRPSTGQGVAVALGMTNGYTYYTSPQRIGSFTACDAPSAGASSENGTVPNNCWRVRGSYDGTLANAGVGYSIFAPQFTQGCEFDVSTVNYSGITFSFDWFTTNQGVHNMQVQYSLDAGAHWTSIGPVLTSATNAWINNNVVDFTSVAGANDNPNFRVRLVSVYDPTTFNNPSFPNGPTYTGASGGVYNNASGNWRFDHVTFNGTPIRAIGPALTAAVNPPAVCGQGGPLTFTVNATPGANPISTGLTVTADLSSLGLSSTQAFYDDGTNGDVTAGDGVFTYAANVPGGLTPGAVNVTATVSDAQGRSASTTIPVSIGDCGTNSNSRVVISEAYGGGGNLGDQPQYDAPYDADFVVLYNRSNQTVSLNGWSVQYASQGSATGFDNYQDQVILSGDIQPGQHVLVRMSDPVPGFNALPTPDFAQLPGFGGMGNQGGRVALVRSTTLIGTDYTNANIEDFLGYGAGAITFEGAAPTATPSPLNYVSTQRKQGGAQDTNQNFNDFNTAFPQPMNRASGGFLAGYPGSSAAAVCAGSDITLTDAVSPASGSTGIQVTADVSSIIGQPGSVTLFDDGTHGDVQANDGIYTLTYTVPSTASQGNRTVNFTVSDAQGHTSVSSLPLAIANCSNSPAPVVISQVYGGGGNAFSGYSGDFAVLFNRSSSPVNLTGWSFQSARVSDAGFDSRIVNLSGIIGPGEYRLIVTNQPSATGAALPPADFTPATLFGMESSFGRVALVSTGNLLHSDYTRFDVVDLVGYGQLAQSFEGVGPTPALDDIHSAVRKNGGCQDTNQNAVDFDVVLATDLPNFSGSPTNACPVVPPSCDPDVNQDGVADQGDVDYLINVIAGGDNPTNINPDFNQDGVADQGDIDALVNVIAGGPCP